MTKTKDISARRILVAIDISKLRNDILIQQTNGRRRRMQITNERVDHDRLVDHLQKMTGALRPPVIITVRLRGDCSRRDSMFT